MKAGTALGLLAGLGAMNAMSGRPYGGQRFTSVNDMFDGGGAGASGDKFQGGGLLSMLGNLFMKPLAAQENVERIADKVREENRKYNQVVPTYGAAEGILNTERALEMPYNQTYGVTGYNVPEVASDYPNMSMPEIAGYTTPNTRADNRPITADVLEQPEKIALTLDEYIIAIGSQPNDYTRAQFADDFVRQFGLGAGSGSSGMTNMGQNSLAAQGYSVSG